MTTYAPPWMAIDQELPPIDEPVLLGMLDGEGATLARALVGRRKAHVGSGWTWELAYRPEEVDHDDLLAGLRVWALLPSLMILPAKRVEAKTAGGAVFVVKTDPAIASGELPPLPVVRMARGKEYLDQKRYEIIAARLRKGAKMEVIARALNVSISCVRGVRDHIGLPKSQTAVAAYRKGRATRAGKTKGAPS